jgi:SAM-dependent methyltransferase
MPQFLCNVCGARREFAGSIPAEEASCGCGSNVRIRALIHLLSTELFGQSLPLTEFPKLKAIRGIGMTDNGSYAELLAEKFDYTNTFYDREPRLDFTESHPELFGRYDFVLSADVLEHIAPPVERAFDEVSKFLKPGGFFAATVPCPGDVALEHFPELHEYRVVTLGEAPVLINRRRDGGLEIREDLLFHGGPGAVLEMRQFSPAELKRKLLGNGFRDVEFLTADVERYGVWLDEEVSQPLIARREKQFEIRGEALRELVDSLNRAEKQIALATNSRWLRLGKALGLGPKFL